MPTLHHLETSRSSRAIWLLEALGVDYALVTHQRNAQRRAQADLAAVHPLGKAPTLVDGELVLVESAAILRYIAARYGKGRFVPPVDTAAHAVHDQWLDYAESSLMPPMLIGLLGRIGGGLPPALEHFAGGEFAKAAGFLGSAVDNGGFLMGAEPMLADIQMSYCLALGEAGGFLRDHVALQNYWQRIQADPGYKRMIEVGGPLVMPFPA